MTHEHDVIGAATEIAHYERKRFLDPREKLGEMRVTLSNLEVQQAEAEEREAQQRVWESLVKVMTPEEFDRAWRNCDEAWALNKRLMDDALFRNFALPLYFRWQAENWTPRSERISSRILPRHKGHHGALPWAMVERINDHLHKRVRRPPFIAACGAAVVKYKNQQPKSSYAIGTEASSLASEITLLSDTRYVESLRAEHEETEGRNAERWPRDQTRRIEQAKKLTEERAKTARRWAKDILAAEFDGRDLPSERRDKFKASKQARLDARRIAVREAGAVALTARNAGIVADIAAGMTSEDAARKHGIATATVRGVLHRAKALCGGSVVPQAQQAQLPERNAAIVAARSAGESAQSVADRFGVSKSVVYNVTHAARRM